MKIKPFELERYFAKYEFTTKYLLSCSDCEPLKMNNLLGMADAESLYLWNDLTIAYTESQGHPLLRSEISKLYENITEEEVMVLVPEEGIFIAMNVLLEQNDHVITTFPGYQSLYEVANSQGCKVSKWLPDANGQFNIQDLFDQVKSNTKLIVFNFPHNPTGATISNEDLLEIINFASERNIFIFSDEMYRFLEYNETDRLPSVADIYENSISLFGMSKTFSLPGLRIGWLTTKNKKVFQQIANFKDYTTICSSAPSEIMAIIGLQNKKEIIANNLEIITNNLSLIDEFAQKHTNIFKWERPKAGTIAFPELKIDAQIDDFCKKLIDEKGVMLLPSSVYNYDKSCVRLGFGRKNMSEALSRLDEFLTAYRQ
jgi:aspartate/methionine/tyrosine aminotransferase